MAEDMVEYQGLDPKRESMNCTHCGNTLTEEESATNAYAARMHGFDLGLCALCWSAWGTMTFMVLTSGWQAGVPNHVSFSDRTKVWEERRQK